MRKLLFTLSLLAFMLNVKAQCDDLTVTINDEVTGHHSITQRKIILVNDKMSLDLTAKHNALFFTVKCDHPNANIKHGAKMFILFTDGSRAVLWNDASTNYSGKYVYMFGKAKYSKSPPEGFGEKQIKTIRVYTFSGYIEENPTALQAEKFNQVFNCLFNKLTQ